MKTLLSSFAILLLSMCIGKNASATTHTITVGDFVFAPATLTVQLGDTIHWVWSNGAHTTTSTTIPAGAATWDAQMNSTSQNFTYMPTVAGTYNYVCTFHSTMGMVGTFTVVGPNTIKANTEPFFAVSPNPANSEIKINSAGQNLQVSMTDAIGHLVTLYPLSNINNEQTYSVNHLASGIYMLVIRANNTTTVQKLFIE